MEHELYLSGVGSWVGVIVEDPDGPTYQHQVGGPGNFKRSQTGILLPVASTHYPEFDLCRTEYEGHLGGQQPEVVEKVIASARLGWMLEPLQPGEQGEMMEAWITCRLQADCIDFPQRYRGRRAVLTYPNCD
jgi:hypothetical protein